MTERPPVRVWRRLLVAGGVLALFVAAFTAVGWVYNNKRTADRLQALFAHLDETDPGWRLQEIEAARAEPEGGNSADVVVRVARLVPGNWPYWEVDPKFENLRFDNVAPPELLDAERAKMLSDEMQKKVDALGEARRLVGMPFGRHKIEWQDNPMNVLMRDQQDTRRSASLLRYDAWNLAMKGDTKGALLAGRAAINAGRALGDEPTAISQLIRTACVAIGLASIERTLALGEASDADLAEVQKLLRLEAGHQTGLVVMRGERAMQHQMFDNMLTGKLSTAEVLGGPAVGAGALVSRFFGPTKGSIRRQQLVMMEFLNEMVEAARLPAHEQFKREAAIEARVRMLPRGDIFVHLMLPAMTKTNAAWRRKTGQIRALDALLAVERYRLKNGKWPERLEDVPKEFLPAVPLDPYDGAPVRYKRTDDGVVVYVLGDNLKDDGGQVERSPAGGLNLDWGFRLWDVKKRRQPPRPPAQEEGPPGGAPGDPKPGM